MAGSCQAVFFRLRPDIVARLAEIKDVLDPAYARLSAEAVCGQFEPLLARMQSFFDDRDADRYARFVAQWVALRMGEGSSAESMIHSIAGLGDVITQVAKHRLDPSSAELAKFLRTSIRLHFLAVRTIIEMLADEHARRQAEQYELMGGAY